MQPKLKKARDDLEKQKIARLAVGKQLESVRETLTKELEDERARAKAEKAEILKSKLAQEERMAKEMSQMESAYRRELRMAQTVRAQMEEEIGQLIVTKDRAVEEYRSSDAFNEDVLWLKKEAYEEGLKSTYQVFEYYECLDHAKYDKGFEDDVKRSGAPVSAYARQWAHLDKEDEGAESEEVDEETAAEEPPVQTAGPILLVVPLAVIPPNAPEPPAGESENPPPEAPKASGDEEETVVAPQP